MGARLVPPSRPSSARRSGLPSPNHRVLVGCGRPRRRRCLSRPHYIHRVDSRLAMAWGSRGVYLGRDAVTAPVTSPDGACDSFHSP